MSGTASEDGAVVSRVPMASVATSTRYRSMLSSTSRLTTIVSAGSGAAAGSPGTGPPGGGPPPRLGRGGGPAPARPARAVPQHQVGRGRRGRETDNRGDDDGRPTS